MGTKKPNATEEPHQVIFRFGPPSKFDHAQVGTRCHVLSRAKGSFDVYIQISKNEDDPIWEYSGIESLEG